MGLVSTPVTKKLILTLLDSVPKNIDLCVHVQLLPFRPRCFEKKKTTISKHTQKEISSSREADSYHFELAVFFPFLYSQFSGVSDSLSPGYSELDLLSRGGAWQPVFITHSNYTSLTMFDLLKHVVSLGHRLARRDPEFSSFSGPCRWITEKHKIRHGWSTLF